ncbi:hypothetical protein K3758_05030 [Sulfitobacter sp. W002]|uniref:hypothetical protein n=1 Tax=Sulfitobacter sp. W002 TaxID=2867024 RepID=UPI0021A4B05F|nr:hypothetical protein [Sulfitobacter sp. W002]UWR30898.1 hypothetical protein K3758_05030 [Sulfitobacter sp. W002]
MKERKGEAQEGESQEPTSKKKMTKTAANIPMQTIMPGFGPMMMNTRKSARHLRRAGVDIYFDNQLAPANAEGLIDEVMVNMNGALHFSAERVYIASLGVHKGQRSTTLPEHEDTIRGAKAQACVASLMLCKVGRNTEDRARLARKLDDLHKELSGHEAICNGSHENLSEKFFTCPCCCETYDKTRFTCFCEGDHEDCLSCMFGGFRAELRVS